MPEEVGGIARPSMTLAGAVLAMAQFTTLVMGVDFPSFDRPYSRLAETG